MWLKPTKHNPSNLPFRCFEAPACSHVGHSMTMPDLPYQFSQCLCGGGLQLFLSILILHIISHFTATEQSVQSRWSDTMQNWDCLPYQFPVWVWSPTFAFILHIHLADSCIIQLQFVRVVAIYVQCRMENASHNNQFSLCVVSNLYSSHSSCGPSCHKYVFYSWSGYSAWPLTRLGHRRLEVRLFFRFIGG